MRQLAASIAIAAVVCLGLPAAASAAKGCGAEAPTIVGSPHADVITGTEGHDVIRAGRGDDRIDGLDGADVVCAGPGDDVIAAGPGDDDLRVGAGDDRATGDDGDDHIAGQGGADEADGGVGVDGCVVEDHENCETDLSTSADGPIPFTGGDQRVFPGRLIVSNLGPSSSLRTLGIGQLPAEAEFVAGESDPRCSESQTDEVTCFGEGIGVMERAVFTVAFRFPDCPPPNHSVLFTADTQDYLTRDPVPANNHYSIPAPVNPAPSCP
jgi:hypothetical protein